MDLKQTILRRMNCCCLFIILTFFTTPIYLKAGIMIVGNLSYEKTTFPLDTYTGSIIVSNTGEETEEVMITQTDYQFNHLGETGSTLNIYTFLHFQALRRSQHLTALH